MGHLNIVLLLLQNGASPDVSNIVSDGGGGSCGDGQLCGRVLARCLFTLSPGVPLSTVSLARLSAFLLTRTCVCCVQRGETALHMAARAGQVEVVRCLLRNGALVDARARVTHLTTPFTTQY